MLKPEKPPTFLHEVSIWAFIVALALGIWLLYSVWPVYQSGGPAAMIPACYKDWRLYATWASIGVSMLAFAIGERRRGLDPFRKP